MSRVQMHLWPCFFVPCIPVLCPGILRSSIDAWPPRLLHRHKHGPIPPHLHVRASGQRWSTCERPLVSIQELTPRSRDPWSSLMECEAGGTSLLASCKSLNGNCLYIWPTPCAPWHTSIRLSSLPPYILFILIYFISLRARCDASADIYIGRLSTELQH